MPDKEGIKNLFLRSVHIRYNKTSSCSIFFLYHPLTFYLNDPFLSSWPSLELIWVPSTQRCASSRCLPMHMLMERYLFRLELLDIEESILSPMKSQIVLPRTHIFFVENRGYF